MVASYVTLVRWTSRIERPPPPPGGPFVLAVWHGRLLMLNYLRHGERPLIAVISGHRDGQLISKIASWFGIGSSIGSSSGGGAKVVRELLRFAHNGHSLFITPDGPRGPNMRAERGVVEIARMTGLPVLPASASASRSSKRRTWDRFLIPLPFGRIVIRWGQPIPVARDASTETVLALVEAAMTAVQHSADEASLSDGSKP